MHLMPEKFSFETYSELPNKVVFNSVSIIFYILSAFSPEKSRFVFYCPNKKSLLKQNTLRVT